MISRDELEALSHEERAELARVLYEMEPTGADFRSARRQRIFLVCCGLIIIGLASWTVGLGLTLPRSQSIGQWRTVWVGFDIAELLAIALAAWAAWRGRQILIMATLVTGTLLLCDAWFDVVLSWNTHERWQSVLSAVIFEVPLALLLWWIARSLVLRSIQAARLRSGLTGSPPALHAILLFGDLPAPTTGR